jgi:hypothetical protein
VLPKERAPFRSQGTGDYGECVDLDTGTYTVLGRRRCGLGDARGAAGLELQAIAADGDLQAIRLTHAALGEAAPIARDNVAAVRLRLATRHGGPRTCRTGCRGRTLM